MNNEFVKNCNLLLASRFFGILAAVFFDSEKKVYAASPALAYFKKEPNTA